MHILVTSPIPSHPQNHGNRARVTALCKALQGLGAKIHFVFGGLEALPLKEELAMREAWDHVTILPPNNAHTRQLPTNLHHRIDDWYLDQVTDITQKILKTWRIDYCIANYVWFSKWLEEVPAGIPKYIDTHDIFADRHKRLIADGLPANWYSTSAREETKGFNRADTVIAIQAEEAREFENRTQAKVVTLGHFIDSDFLPKVQPAEGHKIQIGYMASDNPINQQSLADLNAALRDRPKMFERFEFVLAGAICTCAAAAETPARKLGFVPDAREFYRSMDIIINPNCGGTGLKIKSIEALAFGKALVATKDAMVGIDSEANNHQLADAGAICDHLQDLKSVDRISSYEDQSRHIAQAYMAAQNRAMHQLFPGLTAEPDPGMAEG